jgi:hypothetical protein
VFYTIKSFATNKKNGLKAHKKHDALLRWITYFQTLVICFHRSYRRVYITGSHQVPDVVSISISSGLWIKKNTHI